MTKTAKKVEVTTTTPPPKVKPASAQKTGVKKPKTAASSKPSSGVGGSTWLPKKAHHPLFGGLYAVYASKKSYCVYKPDEGSKPTLLVEITESKTTTHATALRDL
eukprot:8181399-Pyramimonas_sp.AAC.1